MPELLIVGPGAMGCLHAALLAEAGADVALLDYKPERAARLNSEGIVLNWPDGRVQRVRVPVFANPQKIDEPAFIVLMVKAYSTAAAAKHAAAAAGPKTVWATLQNGIGNVEQILKSAGQVRVLAGVTTSGANLADIGQVNVAGIGQTTVGPAARASVSDAQRFAKLWSVTFETEVVADPMPALWRKLIINAAINPLGALTGRRNGELMEIPQLRALSFALAQEAAAVASAQGIDLGDDFDAAAMVQRVCRATAANRCSMLQDLEAGRRTEIDFINGAIARLAPDKQIAELNAAIARLVKTVEKAICS